MYIGYQGETSKLVAFPSSILILHYNAKVCFVNRSKKGNPTGTVITTLKRKQKTFSVNREILILV